MSDITIPTNLLHSYTLKVLQQMQEVTVPTGYRIMLGTNSDVYFGQLTNTLTHEEPYAWLHGFYCVSPKMEWRLAGPEVMTKPDGFLWAEVWPTLQDLVDDLIEAWADSTVDEVEA